MGFALAQATEADVDRLVDIMFAAFAGDPFLHALYPGELSDPEVRKGAKDRMLKQWAEEKTLHKLKSVDTETGEIVGWGTWNLYEKERPESEWNEKHEITWATGRAKEIAGNFLGTNHGLRAEIWAGKPYVLLSLLCVDPKMQRKGAGTIIVNWGIEQSERLALPAYLEASPNGFHLYSKLGFRQIAVGMTKAADWDGDYDYPVVAMQRDPRCRFF